MLKVKVFANGIRVKELELKNLRYFFRGMDVLANKWKINSFTKIQKIKDPDLIQAAYVILIGLIYKYMCTKKGWEVNKKRFKNEILRVRTTILLYVIMVMNCTTTINIPPSSYRRSSSIQSY